MHRTAGALVVRESSKNYVKICNFSMELFARVWYSYKRALKYCQMVTVHRSLEGAEQIRYTANKVIERLVRRN